VRASLVTSVRIVVPFEEEDESSFIGLLQVEAAA
jgi:hypothetical protein